MVVINIGSFVLYLSCEWVIIPPCCCYIWVWINMFVNIISMFTTIFLCTLHDLIISSTPYWGNLLLKCTDLLFHCCHPNWLTYKIDYWNLFFWIYHLFVTCIEKNMLVPNFSIYHIFISILKFFCCFVLLMDLWTFNFKH